MMWDEAILGGFIGAGLMIIGLCVALIVRRLMRRERDL